MMKMRFILMSALLLVLVGVSRLHGESAATGTPLDAEQIIRVLKRSADWQLANPRRIELRDWVIAPLYDGLIQLSRTTGELQYLAAVVRMGTQAGWMPGLRTYFADDHAVGHAWLDIYLMDRSKKLRLTPFKERFDAILAKPIEEELRMGGKPKTPGVSPGDRWTWSDALYMAPPTLARLAKATGDDRYLDFLDKEYKLAVEKLFDPAENLFYRDARFIARQSDNGEEIFWSRGNGWVFAGLPMVIEMLPENRPSRKFYIELLQKMAPAIKASQQADGLWRPSMADPEKIAVGETSGSAFFVFGLAWGVNHGFLDRATYWPVVISGWNGLLTRIQPDGQVGYVQQIGDAPAALISKSTHLYGTGGVLLAGCEIVRGLGGGKQLDPATLLAQAERLLADDKSPRAYARFVPERKDDLAWENDKVVHRIYGPALRTGDEASGIDAWAKSVTKPIIDQWYADDLAGRRSYHKDHGEGYDGYKVGDSLGCGSAAIWDGEKIVHADVYDRARIYWTKPDALEFEAFYTYPAIKGIVYQERRTIRLRVGQNLNEIVSRFSKGRDPAADLEVIVGLTAQTSKAQLTLDSDRGIMAIWDQLQPGGEPFGIGAVVMRGARMIHQPHTTTEPKAEQALAILRTDGQGEIRCLVGFGWAGDGQMSTQAKWLEYLDIIRPAWTESTQRNSPKVKTKTH